MIKELAIELLANYEGLPLPAYAKAGDAGFDLRAAIDAPVQLGPGERMIVPTGLKMAIPGGYEVQVRPRSGLVAKEGLTVLNTPGTIDSGYRGEVGVIAYNASDEPVIINRGDRIAQAVMAPVIEAQIYFVEALDETERGAHGFGSTGVA